MIDRGTGDPVVAKRIQKRRLVDATAAGDIDQVAGRLHRCERGGIHQVIDDGVGHRARVRVGFVLPPQSRADQDAPRADREPLVPDWKRAEWACDVLPEGDATEEAST